MQIAARRNQVFEQERFRREHIAWMRSLTPLKALCLYEAFHRFAGALALNPKGAAKLERLRWKEKVAIRRKFVVAFSKLDSARSG